MKGITNPCRGHSATSETKWTPEISEISTRIAEPPDLTTLTTRPQGTTTASAVENLAITQDNVSYPLEQYRLRTTTRVITTQTTTTSARSILSGSSLITTHSVMEDPNPTKKMTSGSLITKIRVPVAAVKRGQTPTSLETSWMTKGTTPLIEGPRLPFPSSPRRRSHQPANPMVESHC